MRLVGIGVQSVIVIPEIFADTAKDEGFGVGLKRSCPRAFSVPQPEGIKHKADPQEARKECQAGCADDRAARHRFSLRGWVVKT